MGLFVCFALLLILGIVLLIITKDSDSDAAVFCGALTLGCGIMAIVFSIILFACKPADAEEFNKEYNLILSECQMISNSEEVSVNIVNDITERIDETNKRINRNKKYAYNGFLDLYYFKDIANYETISLPTFNKIINN